MAQYGLDDLSAYIQPTPQTLEPTIRPVASPVGSASSSTGAGGLSSLEGAGEMNPLYLLGLMGSVMSRQPGEGPGIAERLLPTYMSQRQHAADKADKLALNESTSREYLALQQHLTDSYAEGARDPQGAVAAFSRRLQQAGFKNKEVSDAAFVALGKMQDKAQVDALAEQDRRGILETMEGYSENRPVSSAQLFTDLLRRRVRGETAHKFANELYKDGIKTNWQNGELAVLDLAGGPVRYFGSQTSVGSGKRPTTRLTRDAEGNQTESIVPGAIAEQNPGDRMIQFGGDGTTSILANRPPTPAPNATRSAGFGYIGQSEDQVMEDSQSQDPVLRQAALETIRTALREGKAQGVTPSFDQLMQAGNTLPGRSAADLADPNTYLKSSTNPPLNESGQPVYVNPAGAMLVNEDQRKVTLASDEAKARASATAPIEVKKALDIAAGQLPLEMQKLREQVRLKRAEEANDPYLEAGHTIFDKKTFLPVRVTKEQGRDPSFDEKYASVPNPEAATLRLVNGAMPQIPAVIDLMKRNLSQSQGGNLIKGAELDFKRLLGSGELSQLRMLLTDLTVENSRLLGGSVRVPVTMLKMIANTLPTNYTNFKAGLVEMQTLETSLKNRQLTLTGQAPQAYDTGGGRSSNGLILPPR